MHVAFLTTSRSDAIYRRRHHEQHKAAVAVKAMVCVSMFCAALLSGCVSLYEDGVSTVFNPLQCQTIPASEDNEQLCVMITKNRGDLWFVVGDNAYAPNHYVEGVSFMGDGGAASFGEFSISPGGSYLAVIIAEEGHPTLLLARLQNWLRGKGEPEGLPAIAVYPGSVSIKEWRGDDQLVISSDQDLVHYQHGGELGQPRDYLLHLPDGTLAPR